MVPPTDMLLFAAVVREGSFTKAATLLKITKQSASERIGKLEQRLGVRLLERTTRRLRATDAGSTYYERCASIAMQIEEANLEVMRRQAEPVGLLRVSTPVLYGRRYLAPVVATFLMRHPRMRVELVLADRRVNLIEEGIDLAIRIGVLDDSSLTAKKLGDGHVYFVASPAFLASHAIRDLQDVRHHPCIGLHSPERWEGPGGKIKVEPVLVVNDHEVACEDAIAGVGVAQLPAIVCRDAVDAGQLRVLFGPAPALQRSVFAVFPSRAHLPSKVRLFLETLSSIVEPMRPLDDPHTSSPAPRAAKARSASTRARSRESK